MNKTVNLKSSAAVTATGQTADLINRDGRGLVVAVVTSAHSGTSPTLVVKVQGKGPSGTYYDIPGAATATINTDTTTLLTVYPGVTVVANGAVSQPMPRVYRVVWTIGGTTPSFTFAVDGQLLM